MAISSVKGADVINLFPEDVSFYESFLYTESIGDIWNEGKFFPSSISTISELGGEGTKNIISKVDGDNYIHFIDSYSTSILLLISTLLLDFSDYPSIPSKYSMITDCLDLRFFR